MGVSRVSAPVAHIGHVELLTPRPRESLEFFRDLLGLEVTSTVGDSVYLRGYGDYQETGFKLTAATAPGLGHVGFRARSQEALEACVAELREGGVEGAWIGGDVGHGPAFGFDDPAGHRFEVYHEIERRRPPAGLPKNRLGARGNGAIGVSRVDHFNLFAADVAANRAFCERFLGCRTLDLVLDDDGREVGAFTTLTNKPLDVVYTADGSGRDARLHHLAFWVDTREEVLRSADVCVDRGVEIEVAPALHTVGQSFFLYVFEPGGNRIEVTTGAELVLDPDGPPRVWTAAERRAGVGWGTAFPDSWRTYGTPPA
ncbi:MAG: VOC family protein [Solirubrobacterales bacterium]